LAAAYAFTPVLVAGESVQQIFNINDRGQTVVNTDLSSGIFHRGTFTRLPPVRRHLKFGISNNPGTRYTREELGGGSLRIVTSGDRADMLRLERSLH